MDENVEELIFIWLRSIPDRTTSDELLSIDHVQEIINDVRVFDDADECISDLLSIGDEMILIRLGYGRSHLVDTLIDIEQVQCIYLSEPYEVISTPVVRGVLNNTQQFLNQLKRDVRMCENRYTHLTSCETNILRLESTTQDLTKHQAQFMWSQMLFEMLIQIPSPPNYIYKDLIDEARRLYSKNRAQLTVINDFEQNYRPDDAVRWYTRDSFLFKIVNKALRTRNIIIIFKFRFFIRDICKQLLEIQRNQPPLTEIQTLYRGQFISPDELTQLQRGVGGLVSMNTFISTTKDHDVALIFTNTGPRHPLFESAIFEYVIEPSLSLIDAAPFADISHYSSIESENEILLSVGTVAEILSVSPVNGNKDFHCIRLRLCHPKNSPFSEFKKFLLKQLKMRNVSEADYIYQMGNLLYIMGEFTKSQQLFKLFPRCSDPDLQAMQSLLLATGRFNEHVLESDDIGSTAPIEVRNLLDAWQSFANNPQISPAQRTVISMIHGLMTSIKAPWEEQDTNNDRLSVTDQSNQMNNQVELMSNILSSIAPSHPIMPRIAHLQGELRSIQGDHTGALEHYERARQMSDLMLGENHSLRPLLLYEMAESAEKQGDDDKAIELLQQSIASSNKDSSLHILTLNALAALFEKRKDWALAITCYQDITSLHYLPPNSLELLEAYISIGTICIPLNNFAEAALNFQHVFDLLHQHHPVEHLLPTNLRAKIDVIRNLFVSLGLRELNSERHV